ncbi:MAG TPA: YggS family pyridoxal phosphate-dependent enzyme [Dehalococcoidales bacterium]|nr:YggS family pyridoxal phosphate-dependent enzyme [Dehalococcoidales bacterium]
MIQLLGELPPDVLLVAAAKTREPSEILAAIDSGIKIIGENYVQEAERAYGAVGKRAEWHFIGHLQKNKVKKAVAIFDMIETVDSLDIAEEIGRRSGQIGKTMPVLVEINSGREPNKSGIFPEHAAELITDLSRISNVHIMGLMTMGPPVPKAEDMRRYFRETKALFEKIKALAIPGVEMKYLSMGMTDSYQIAIEEGANIIRLGTKIFGERHGSTHEDK